jgi:uncharacterized membrane protein YhaH (DUF805 family)
MALTSHVCVPTCFGVAMFMSGIVAIEVWNTQFPVWAFVFALLICASVKPSFVYLLAIYYPTFSVCVRRPDWSDSGYHEQANRA